MFHQVTATLTPADGCSGLDRDTLQASNLHGLLFQVILPAVSAEETTWLHEHPAPKPFALAPLYTGGQLSGLRLTAWTERAAELILSGWQGVYEAETVLRLGRHSFQVSQLHYTPQVEFLQLVASPAERRLHLRFITPTAFRQGPLRLHLPVPANVFDRPAAVWQAYAPATLKLPADWPDWCQQNVMVRTHHIRTMTVPFNRRARFIGFTGSVQFEAVSKNKPYLCLWQALGRLAAYSGVGYKTAMGMGAVELGAPSKHPASQVDGEPAAAR